MRKTANIFTLLFCIFLCGCESESYRAFEETQVKIESSNVVFTAAGGTGTIVVATSDLYTATVNQSWCKLSTSGNTITITTEPNMGALARSANVTIKQDDKINFVPVTQTGVYLHLDSYETINFLGKGGSISFPYESDAPVTVTSNVSWLTATSQNGMILLQAAQNPDFLKSRNTTITLTAGNNLISIKLEVNQGELITSYEPDPNINSVDNFLNLKNNGGTSSRYKITYFSSRIETLYKNLKAAYPIFQEMRIEAPRSSYKLSVILYNLDGTTASYQYWNATNGLVPVNDSKSIATFMLSGDSYSGTVPYTSNTNYTQLKAVFASDAGFTIIPDTGNIFWFRSVANPTDYFKVEPGSW